MQDVHTRRRRPAPFTIARTDCKFKFQRRFVTLWAWLMRLPNLGPRPQTSQICAMTEKLLSDSNPKYTTAFVGGSPADVPVRCLQIQLLRPPRHRQFPSNRS